MLCVSIHHILASNVFAGVSVQVFVVQGCVRTP